MKKHMNFVEMRSLWNSPIRISMGIKLADQMHDEEIHIMTATSEE